MLRLAAGEVDGLERIAAALGADVTSQLAAAARCWSGAPASGSSRCPSRASGRAVLMPDDAGLATADVYREADRLGLARARRRSSLALRERLLAAASAGASPLDYPDLLVNDLGEAALSLRPEIGEALEALREAGAEHALVTGSGPTAVGLFARHRQGRRRRLGAAPALLGCDRDRPPAAPTTRFGAGD